MLIKRDKLWKIEFDGFKQSEQPLREALTTLGNGYFGTRGAFPEARISNYNYPATYMAGLYNKLKTKVSGKNIYNEDFVNCPNWTFLSFRIDTAEVFYPSINNILEYKKTLDMKRGIAITKYKIKDEEGRITKIEEKRFVSMKDFHKGGISYKVTPQNYSCKCFKIISSIDGSIENLGVSRYKSLSKKHWKVLKLKSSDENIIGLISETNNSKILFSAFESLSFNNKYLSKKVIKNSEKITQEFTFSVRKKRTITAEKIVNLDKKEYSEKRRLDDIKSGNTFKSLLKEHVKEWGKVWDVFDIQIKGDDFSQKAIRFQLFHLLQSASKNNQFFDAGFTARGLHGEAYRGHIFWDEVFGIPFYNLNEPIIAKSLIEYRFKRLKQAKKYAKVNGYKGAMFPWQSGLKGDEQTQTMHLNPNSGKWGDDLSRLQRHVSFGIAYNVLNYFESTNDELFMKEKGLEILINISLFCTSLVKYNKNTNKYHTSKIMGPDEFHEKLPQNKKAGLEDNAYSNLMISWVLKKTIEIIEKELFNSIAKKKFKIDLKKLSEWKKIQKGMNIIVNSEGIISQFKGYFNLKSVDLKQYKKKYRNIQRMDRILKAEGKSPNEYNILKQADFLMIFYLLDFDEVINLFKDLGHNLSKKDIKNNFNYYIKRTSHGSTLSKVVHSMIAQKLGIKDISNRMFKDVVIADLYDIQGGTTPEGIHTGVMGGCINIIYKSFLGLNFKNNCIEINSQLPKHWKEVSTKIRYKDNLIIIKVQENIIFLKVIKENLKNQLSFKKNNETIKLIKNKKIKINL